MFSPFVYLLLLLQIISILLLSLYVIFSNASDRFVSGNSRFNLLALFLSSSKNNFFLNLPKNKIGGFSEKKDKPDVIVQQAGSSIIYFLLLVPVLAIILLALNVLLSPHNPYTEKESSFECGFHSFLGQNRQQFNISFFLFGLLFLIFDLEIILIFPAKWFRKSCMRELLSNSGDILKY